MSGSHEAGDRPQDAETPPVPASAAPPSFGKAEPPAAEAASAAGEKTADEGSVPVEIRLPIGLQKPWWADDDEPAPTAPEPAPEPERAAEPEEAKPEASESEEAAEPEEIPGTLVAGTGVPSVDTRRAVPNKPIVERPRPASRDTDPDGIPAVTATEPEPEPAAQPEPAPEPEPDPPAPEAEVSGQVLSPDSFLPPGTTPPEDGDRTPTTPTPIPTPMPAPVVTEASKETRPQVITPVYHAEGGLSIDSTPFADGLLNTGTDTGSGKGTGRASGGRRKALLIGGGVAVVALLIGAGGFVVANGGSDSTTRRAGAAETSGPQVARNGPAPSQSPSSTPTPPSEPSVIDSVRTDPKPLALTEAFPTSRIVLAGRAYARDRSSVNHQCALVARGAMAKALTALRCSSVVRVTYLDRKRSLAVTSGIAVLPTKAAALKANTAGDPSRYEWFRGMPGKRAPDIDRAGGYAASTVRGRYIVYAYATYANGKRPLPGDPMLKAVAEQFVGYALRPIDTRARG
ncbi:hypothetical protein [Actinomadura sp. NBRC 104412]|uniref:hypothetical protein n=1 Tax=Actinomadura sp. NBRC 104412 TaxID=3032203 RepID=UPI002553C0DD|nr:hypothetical protein [Actinomadura sp. NBRC 104412]